MNRDHKKFLVLALVLAAGALIVVFWKPGAHETQDASAGKNVFPETELPLVNKVQVKRGEDHVVIEMKDNGVWRIVSDDGFPANASKVANLLDQLSKSKFQRSISNAQKSWVDFGLDHGTQLTLFKVDQEILNLNLGNGRSGGGQFVSKTEDNSTAYMIDNKLSVEPTADAWENRIVIDVEEKAIKKVEFVGKGKVKKPQAIVAREKPEDKLQLMETTPKDKILLDAIDSVGHVLTSLQFTHRRYLNNQEAKTALQHAFKTRVWTFDGREYDVNVGSIGEKEKQKFYLRIQAKGTSAEDVLINEIMGKWNFEISNYDAKKLTKVKKDFFEATKS